MVPSIRQRVLRRVLLLQFLLVAVALILVFSLARFEADPAAVASTIESSKALDRVSYDADGGITLECEDDLNSTKNEHSDYWIYARKNDDVESCNTPSGVAQRIIEIADSVVYGDILVPPGPGHGYFFLQKSDGLVVAVGATQTSRGSKSLFLLRLFWDYFLLNLLLSVVVVVAALIAVPRDVTRALETLSKTAASGNAEDPEFRLDTTLAPPEVSGLVRSFNLLLDRLQELSQRQRRFLSDVAHELRTPLAIMRLRLDDLPDSDDRVQLSLDVDRLDGRIEALLALARLREGLQVPQIVDLAHIAREIVIDRAPRAMAARCDLSIDVQGAAMVIAGRALIETAATNLVDNAIAHAGAGASIVVRVQAEGILEVIDDGRGIPSDRRTGVLQPFSRDSEAGLLGLGLALVNEAVLAMGGTFTLVETEGGGTTARLQIPSQTATELASG